MNLAKKWSVAAILATSLMAAYPAVASPLGSSLREFKAPTSWNGISQAPLAYHIFCLKSPKDCRPGGPSIVHLSAKTMSKLNLVNYRVNKSIRYSADSKDVWGAKGGKGDCEDYVLEKRRQLIRMGIPSGAVRLAAVRTKKGEGHAVLVVKTTKGDMILDNIRKTIVAKNRTGYRFLATATSNPLRWNSM